MEGGIADQIGLSGIRHGSLTDARHSYSPPALRRTSMVVTADSWKPRVGTRAARCLAILKSRSSADPPRAEGVLQCSARNSKPNSSPSIVACAACAELVCPAYLSIVATGPALSGLERSKVIRLERARSSVLRLIREGVVERSGLEVRD